MHEIIATQNIFLPTISVTILYFIKSTLLSINIDFYIQLIPHLDPYGNLSIVSPRVIYSLQMLFN